MAKRALARHDKTDANQHLSYAETLMLTRSVSSSNGKMDNSPSYMSVTKARTALRAGHFQTAKTDVEMALRQLHQGNGGMGAGTTSSTGSSTPSGTGGNTGGMNGSSGGMGNSSGGMGGSSSGSSGGMGSSSGGMGGGGTQ